MPHDGAATHPVVRVDRARARVDVAGDVAVAREEPDLEMPYVGKDGGREVPNLGEQIIRFLRDEMDEFVMQVEADLGREDSGGCTEKAQNGPKCVNAGKPCDDGIY